MYCCMRQETPVDPGMVVSSTMQNRCASLQAFRLPFLSLGGDVLFGVFDRLTRDARSVFDIAIRAGFGAPSPLGITRRVCA